MKKLVLILSLAFLFLLATTSLFSVYTVYGNLMEPNLSAGQPILAIKHFRLHRGDIVIYDNSGSSRIEIARIIALPGETFQLDSGQILISEGALNKPQALNESYRTGYTKRSISKSEPVTVPAGHFLLLKDNESSFSSSKNIIPDEKISAKYLLTLNSHAGKI